MKKVLGLILIAIFLSYVTGCTPKSEYEKLLDQKTGLDEKIQGLSAETGELKQKITAKEMEIRDLRNALKTESAKVQSLEKELARLKEATPPSK